MLMQQILDQAATVAQVHDHATGPGPYAAIAEGVVHTQADQTPNPKPGDLIPDPDPTPPKGKFKEAADTIIGLLKWGGLVCCMGALMVGAIMMSVGRRRQNHLAVEGAMSIPWVFGSVALISGGASLLGWFLGT